MNEFIKKHKMQKVLEKCKHLSLFKGDRYSVFSAMYEVCTEPTDEVILKDQFNNKIAIPKKKLFGLIKSGLAQKVGNIYKAGGGVPKMGGTQASSSGNTAAPASAKASGAAKPETGSSNTRSFPVGTIHNGRKKVSDNPSKWVDMHSGDSFDDHKTSEKHETRTPDTKKAVSGFMNKVSHKLHPADVKGVEEKLHKFIEAKAKVNNMMQAANRDSKQEGGFNSVMKQVHKKHDEVAKLKSEFVQTVKESMQRKKEHGV